MTDPFKYEVAISFAEEDRNAALALTLALELSGFRTVYYYHDLPGATVGKRLRPELRKIYLEESRYVVMLLSKKYLKKKTGSPAATELDVIYERISKDSLTVEVIPVTLDDKPGMDAYPMLAEMTWLRWDFNPKKIAALLRKSFGADKGELFAKPIEKKVSIQQSNEALNARDQQNNLHIKL